MIASVVPTERFAETITHERIQRIHMSTSIRVSDETKSMLTVLKEDSESWDEFLARLARKERDVDELGGFADAGIEESMTETHEQLNESLAENVREE